MDYFKAWEKSGNFTLSQGKFSSIFITVDKAWNVCSNGVGTMVNKIWKNMAGKMLKGMTSLFGIIWKRLVDCMGET